MAERIVVNIVQRKEHDKHGNYVTEQQQLLQHAVDTAPKGCVVVDMGTSFIGGMHFTDTERAKFLDSLDGPINRLKAMARLTIDNTTIEQTRKLI